VVRRAACEPYSNKHVNPTEPDHYASLGLERRCSSIQIRDAYRSLAKRRHPDLNRHDAEAQLLIQALNAAYEILSDPARRHAYDRELDENSRAAAPASRAKIERNVSQDVRLRIEDFLRGTTLDVRVNDPANPDGPETYELHVAPGTAPGTRLRLARAAPFEGGFVLLRLKTLPGFRFKIRGSDLRCDLRISARRAEAGGIETISGPTGLPLRVLIPARVKRGELIKIAHEGMPKSRGGRGDLLVRITYRLELRVSRSR